MHLVGDPRLIWIWIKNWKLNVNLLSPKKQVTHWGIGMSQNILNMEGQLTVGKVCQGMASNTIKAVNMKLTTNQKVAFQGEYPSSVFYPSFLWTCKATHSGLPHGWRWVFSPWLWPCPAWLLWTSSSEDNQFIHPSAFQTKVA